MCVCVCACDMCLYIIYTHAEKEETYKTAKL